ncbi:beta-Ig-H3 fasciclin [Micractinium conductrix]|uniref:Beta-Ig-H3 fasciclin n=1 Tax=Micractinium conductrix TaxID=554055 RepID=A0A2P6VLC3_9CHLO|nr:beta-Ig-H3 fasciclin [Micractinium conductrix]|eukprot:PSC74857.1 beta-Ig-H3 fasciclin [Micractinium conductrix]
MKAACAFAACLALLALATPAAAHCNYLIDEGESLSSIAKGYELTVEGLLAINPQIENPDLIIEGDVLRVPCANLESEGDVNELLGHRNDTYYIFTAIQKTGLAEALSDGNEEITVFAPTDEAFELFLTEANLNLTTVLANKELLTEVLKYHVVTDGAVKAAKLEDNQELSTLLDDQSLVVVLKNGTVELKTSSGQTVEVVQADLEGGDAVVHLISEVLVPGDKAAAPTPTAAPSNNKKCTHVVKEGDTLFKLAQKYKTTLEAVTKLNPTIKNPDLIAVGVKVKVDMRVCAALLLGLALAGTSFAAEEAPCSYAVQAGDSLFGISDKFGLTQAEVESANAELTNTSLIQPGDVLVLPCKGDATEGDSVLDLLARRSDMTTLFSALLAAGPEFVDTVNDTNLVATVFAPNNTAFGAILSKLNLTLADLVDDKELLGTVLQYHVAPGVELKARELKDGLNITTLLEGESLVVYKPKDVLRLEETSGRRVRVGETDLQAGKAVVHTLWNVLWPADAAYDLPEPTGECVHTVAPGDTLWALAEKYGTTAAALIEINPALEKGGGAALAIGSTIVLFPSCVV